MLSQWGWFLWGLTRRLWFRATLISLLAVAAAFLAFVLRPYIPDWVPTKLGADAVDSILSILASSMLAVTTFSLSTMVAAYASATSSASPRATRLLIEDSTTQNVLATFVGSFLYSLVAIITLATGAYGQKGRVVLFVVTLLVVLLIVVTLVRWIDYLLRLGRVGETANQVEIAAVRAMRQRARRPNLGGRGWSGEADALAEGARPVMPDHSGYVQHIDMQALQDWAEAAKASVFVAATPGSFVDPGEPLAFLTGESPDDPDKDDHAIRAAFAIAKDRTFDQDPSYGLSVLSEIASRALSPAVNDPGTAIDAIGRAVRILLVWTTEKEADDPEVERVFVPSIGLDALFNAFFTPVARDGAAIVEVHVRLQRAFLTLGRCGREDYRREALRHADLALGRAEDGMQFQPDVDAVRAAHAAARQAAAP